MDEYDRPRPKLSSLDALEAETESLEKYRPCNFEFNKPKGDDINDLMDFYSNYKTQRNALGRVHGARRNQEFEDEEPRRGRMDYEQDLYPRKKFSDPENYTAQDPTYRQNNQEQRNNGNGLDEFDSIDPATRLILEKARQTRSKPILDFRNPYENQDLDEFEMLRPPRGRIISLISIYIIKQDIYIIYIC